MDTFVTGKKQANTLDEPMQQTNSFVKVVEV